MLFEWDDGVHQYSTDTHLPNVEHEPEIRGQVVPTLDNGAVWVRVEKAGSTDITAPKVYQLSWDRCPDALADIIKEAFEHGYAVDATFPDTWVGSRTVSVTGYYVIKAAPFQVRGRKSGLRVTLAEVRV